MQQALNLKSDVAEYEYMKHGMTADVPGLDDIEEFAEMETSMTDCGLDAGEKSAVFRESRCACYQCPHAHGPMTS